MLALKPSSTEPDQCHCRNLIPKALRGAYALDLRWDPHEGDYPYRVRYHMLLLSNREYQSLAGYLTSPQGLERVKHTSYQQTGQVLVEIADKRVPPEHLLCEGVTYEMLLETIAMQGARAPDTSYKHKVEPVGPCQFISENEQATLSISPNISSSKQRPFQRRNAPQRQQSSPVFQEGSAQVHSKRQASIVCADNEMDHVISYKRARYEGCGDDQENLLSDTEVATPSSRDGAPDVS